MKTIITNILIGLGLTVLVTGCKKEVGNLNGPTPESLLTNASVGQLNDLVNGAESGMRNNLALYLDDIGILGREGYYFPESQQQAWYTTDLLGAGSSVLSSSGLYITSPWASRYQVVKNCNLLVQAATRSTHISGAQKSGYIGFARTIKAYQLLLNLNLTDTNGIRFNVDIPDQLGPFVKYNDALTAITAILDSAATDLSEAVITFQLSNGFSAFNDAAGLLKVNRALAARVAIYAQQWAAALTDLNASFFDVNQSFYLGISHAFSNIAGDQPNPMYIPQNQYYGIRLAHPSFTGDIIPGDDRIAKATLRTNVAIQPGLLSDRDVWLYKSAADGIPIIRNEELILIYAEANIQTNHLPEAIVALNRIRTGHNLSPYAGGITQSALLTEVLYQRRYSLFYEGHRWIDMRRYNLLSQLPLDRAGDNVWSAFPLPVSEQ